MQKKSLLFLILLVGILILPETAKAAILEGIILNIVRTVWIITVGIVICLWIVTGFLFLSALGDPSKLRTARIALLASIGGTILIILSGGAIGTISNALGL